MSKFSSISTVLFLSFFLVACGGGGGDSDSSSTSSPEQPPSEVTPDTAAQVTSAQSLSQHFVEITFDNPVDQSSLSLGDIALISEQGQPLTVKNQTVYESGMGMVLETAAQAPVLYSMTIPENRQTSSITFTEADNFIGSTGPEPFVQSVTALTNTTVLITMDRDIDDGYANTTEAYRILAPNGGIPNEDIGRIEVLSAEVQKGDEQRIILTTTPLSNIEYVLQINNIITQAGSKLIHPDRNGGYFFGIEATDIDAPKLLRAVSTSHTGVLASFNEPLWDDSTEPSHYAICEIAIDFPTDKCPVDKELKILSIELSNLNTQVLFNTSPQESGLEYILYVDGVTDRATPAPGNKIADGTMAIFIGSGSGNPEIASSIAIDNNHVLITFTERMSADILNSENYRIEEPPLDVKGTKMGDDNYHVILETTDQQRIEYNVVAIDIRSAEGLLMSDPPKPSSFIGFDAKDIQKPYLIAAIAETSNRIRLYFSEPLADSAQTPNAYNITFCPEFTDCSGGSSSLDVLSAVLVESDTQVLLTVNNIAPRVVHTVVVDSTVTDQAMPIPHNSIDPNLNSAEFGLLLEDKDLPEVGNITFTSNNTITLTFNEQINPTAANPLYYRVCTTAFVNGTCPANSIVQVLGVVLNESQTQVQLTVEPLLENTTYYVFVTEGVTDTSGNKINIGANTINAFYQGATSVIDPSELPQVVGAISTSNIKVTVSYNTVMGVSALEPSNYLFTQENVNSEVGTVFSMAVDWVDETHTSVSITTTSQNEVTYRVTAVNVKDKLGNPLATQESTFNPNYDPRSSVFAGSPPIAQNLTLTDTNFEFNGNGTPKAGDSIIIDGISLVLVDNDLDGTVDNWVDANGNEELDSGDSVSGQIDSDADGIADNEELRGTTVVITLTNGETINREVTSDPTTNDTDKDGLTDSDEWSFGFDPRSSDTDNDGLTDFVEWNVVYSDATNQDSDGDELPDGLEHNSLLTSPLLADTDGDQFSDSEEVVSLNRNPKIADVPKLGIEVNGINLQIDERYTYVNSEGNVVSSESSTSTALTNSQNTSFASSTTTFREKTSSFKWDVGFGLRDAQADDAAVNGLEAVGGIDFATALYDRFFIEVGLGGTTETHTGTNTQIDAQSAREAQQALENSFNKFNEQAQDEEVTRELVGAKISANITVKNKGDVAFTVKNLQVSVSQIDPQNPSEFLPIATLIAESALITGNDLEINIGPFDENKGPFVFTNNEVYPAVIETFMRDPKSLVFKVVNYDITDEYERGFAFSSQFVHDRTAGISFDYGELGYENFQVATNGVLDNNQYLGGFDETGKNKGMPLGYLLENILGIVKHDTSQNYIAAGPDGTLTTVPNQDDVSDGTRITAGADGVLTTKVAIGDLLLNENIKTGIIADVNKRVDTRAQGDDIQLVPFGTTGVAPRTLVIDPGENGILDSIQANGDQQAFISGYEVQSTCSVASTGAARVGQYCLLSDNTCECNGPKGLVRVKTFSNGDYGANWFARVEGDMPTAVDFDAINIKAGQSIRLAFLQDLDKDGLFAHEEFLFGSVDSAVDNYRNDDFGPTVINNRYFSKTLEEYEFLPDGEVNNLADSIDTDRDGIGDLVEAKLGWLITRNGQITRVFSSPATPDSDNDGLWDIQEQDLRGFCADDDPRKDALCIEQDVEKVNASAIIVGKNGKLDSVILNDDVYAFVSPDNDTLNRDLMFATVGILPGDNGIIDSNLVGDDEYSNSQVVLPATDPLLSDTDNDGLNDGVELFGFAAGMAIVETTESECYDYDVINNAKVCKPNATRWGIVETVAQGDDVQRVFPGSPTKAGDVIITAGLNGILETQPLGNDSTVSQWFIAAGPDRTLNSLVVDDISNYNYPENISAGDNVVVYPGDMTFLEPYAPAIWNASGMPDLITDANFKSDKYVEPWEPVPDGSDIKLYGTIVTTDPLRRDTDNDTIPDGFEVAIGANPTVIDDDEFKDSDFDGLSDKQESRGWIVSVNGSVGTLVRPSSVLADSDYDGLPDYVERDIGSDPNDMDTDDDGLDDYQEFRSITRETIDGTKYNFSIYNYANIEALFSGFNLVINPDAYSTDPNLNDSDGDILSDYEEVINGYQVTLTNELYPGEMIFTDPNNADSDGDGLSDYQERNNFNDSVTNANDVDTDGDGTDDFTEISSELLNPLMKDALVTVSYDSLFVGYMGDCGTVNADGEFIECPTETNLLWWLYSDGNDGTHNENRLLSSSDEFAYTPDGTVRPVASGHQRLLEGIIAPSDIPDSSATQQGLLMQTSLCTGNPQFDEGVGQGTDCSAYEVLTSGERGYSADAFIDWGRGGVPFANDNFKVKWSGEIYLFAGETRDVTETVIDDTVDPPVETTITTQVEMPRTYEFHFQSDDGVRFAFNNADLDLGSPIRDSWSLNSNQNLVETRKITESGWYPIAIEYFEHGGNARLLFQMTSYIEGDPKPAIARVPLSLLRYPLGNGSYACVAIERDPTQTSFVSLNRSFDMDNNIAASGSYAPGISYYGSLKGSEIKIFKDIVATDVDNDYSRFYVDFDPGVIQYNDGTPLITKDIMSVAVDLAASRRIINGLVKPDVSNNSIITPTELKTDLDGRRYFELSNDGQMLYRQLSQPAGYYGQQQFVLREGESLNLSGVLMRVDDIESLTSCPIGSNDVVSQFESGCMKRFSRSLTYEEVVAQAFMPLNLNELRATTTSSNNDPASCEIELDVTISH